MSVLEAGKCPVCREPIVQPAKGRRRKWCSDRCRKEIYTWRKLRSQKAAWLESWREPGWGSRGPVARSAVASLEYQLAVLAELDEKEREEFPR
jgi:predicted nucleic acid-binding Zn ribbon protein